MADPERDFGMAYDEQGYVHILHSTFFDVDPEVDKTAQGYIDHILDTLVDAVEEQLGTVEWRLAPDPKIYLKSSSVSYQIGQNSRQTCCSLLLEPKIRVPMAGRKGGKSTLENCQVLQATVNRFKGNKTEISKSDLIQKSAYCRVSGRDLDLVELSAYGNVRRAQDSGGCNIQ
ncbi:hypothetical protein M5K25_017926 [Dendrobium thyrsiflorum]|uniref:Uncharacterized protein n=1 Tax=Dendrobium thyrsiflorum TaxID=117978 RepID=A0ABD0UHB0_DENTH